jgi:hypothetical protein
MNARTVYPTPYNQEQQNMRKKSALHDQHYVTNGYEKSPVR